MQDYNVIFFICRYINVRERAHCTITVSQLYSTLHIFTMIFTSLKTQITYCRRSLFLTYHISVPSNLMLENSAFAYVVYLFVSRCVLGSFGKLQSDYLLHNVCLSACPHGTPRLPQNEFSWISTFEYFPKICTLYWIIIKIAQYLRVLYKNTKIHIWSYLVRFFLDWEMFQAIVVEGIKTRNLCPINFFSNIVTFMRQCGKTLQNEEGHGLIYVACALHAGLIRRHENSQYVLIIAFPHQQLLQ
jgi:hypothetical protein